MERCQPAPGKKYPQYFHQPLALVMEVPNLYLYQPLENCSIPHAYLHLIIIKCVFACTCCLLLLYMTLFVCHFVPPCEVSEGIVCVSVPLAVVICLSVCLCLIIHLHWEIWFWQVKPFSFYDLYNHNHSQKIADDLILCY